MQFVIKKGTIKSLLSSNKSMTEVVDYILQHGEIIELSGNPDVLSRQYSVAMKLTEERDKEIFSFDIESMIL